MTFIQTYRDTKLRTKLQKQYKTIKELYDKTEEIEIVDELGQEIKDIQQAILLNNYNDVAHLYNSVLQPIDPTRPSTTFSLKGCKSRVHRLTPNNIETLNLTVALHANPTPLINTELKFKNLTSKGIKTKVFKAIQQKTNAKIHKKIEKYTKQFKENSDTIYSFIINTSSILIPTRLQFIHKYFYFTWETKNMEEKSYIVFDKSYKDMLYTAELQSFLTGLNMRDYDFIIEQ